MSARSRRQTRRLRLDGPRRNWPPVHNERTHYRKLGGRAYFIYQLCESFGLMAQQLLDLGGIAQRTAAAMQAARAEQIRAQQAAREQAFSDLMSCRGFDMREDYTLAD